MQIIKQLTKRRSLSSHLFQNETGGALLMVLIFIPILALGAMAAYHYSGNRTDIVYYDFHRQQARYTAEAGLQRLIAEIEFNNAFITKLDDMTSGETTGNITDDDSSLIERYGLEGEIQMLGDHNQDIAHFQPIQPNIPTSRLALFLKFFSVSDAHAASYGTGATYQIRLREWDFTNPDEKKYTFEATGKTYPTTTYDPNQINAEVETQKVDMQIAVTNSGITPPPPPTCEPNATCRESSGGACGTLGDDDLYRYSYFAGNTIGHTGFEISFFGSNAPLTYHAGNQYNSKDDVTNGSCEDGSTQVVGCDDNRWTCRENNDVPCTETDDLAGGRSGLSFMNWGCAMFGPGMYGTNECIEAETDVRIDCKFCMFMIGTGYQGDYYGDSSTCSDQTAPPAVAFEDVVGPAYGNATDGYSLDSAKQIIINKVTNNGATTLADGWNTGTGDFSNYHYWKPALPDQNLADFNFFNTTLLSKKNNVYYIEGSLNQFNLASGDINLLNAFSKGSITIIAENDINLTSVTDTSFEFMADGAASLHFIAGNNISDSTVAGFTFNIGQASEINLVALNNISLTTIMEFNFSLFGVSGMHAAARNNLSIKDGLNFTFGWGGSYYSSKDSSGRGEPTEVASLCDTTGCVEEDPESPISGTIDVNIIKFDFT